MDFYFLRAHDRPTAFGFYAAHGGVSPRPGVAHPIAVGDLVEAVLGDHGTDLYRFKEDVEAGVTSHQCHSPVAHVMITCIVVNGTDQLAHGKRKSDRDWDCIGNSEPPSHPGAVGS